MNWTEVFWLVSTLAYAYFMAHTTWLAMKNQAALDQQRVAWGQPANVGSNRIPVVQGPNGEVVYSIPQEPNLQDLYDAQGR